MTLTELFFLSGRSKTLTEMDQERRTGNKVQGDSCSQGLMGKGPKGGGKGDVKPRGTFSEESYR